ncbi:BREX-1 system phosphatase PglZ type A [Rufibacter psychrotolerans]|uniref:BREX-1 system phosphatase PglZ type A n=1 Tax=Rufibacter psychrotolerans TaxID=2812556 RepID=UPI001966F3A8|nr:BREX-1 system phosphatase PglZ type A [Rufibacter sp. SYSU D00308]
MLQEKIEKYYRTHPHLRVLFFFDRDQDFKDEVEALELDNIRVIQFEHNYFYLKTMLHGEWKQDKVFLYLPMQSPKNYEDYKQFPLLDLLLANKELLLDDEAAFMEEHRLQRHHQPLIKRYMRELKYSLVQEVCAPILKPETLDESVLVQALFSAFLKFKSPECWPVLLAKLFSLLRPGQEEELKRVGRKVRDNNLLEWLNKQVKQHFDQEISEFSSEKLAELLKVLKYNSLMQYITDPATEDPYKSLKVKKRQVLARMNQLQEEANRKDGLGEQLQEAIEANAGAIQELKLMEVYGSKADFAYYTLQMKWQLIAEQVTSLDINPQSVIQGLEKISVGEPTTPSLNSSLTFIIHAAEMVKLVNAIPTYILDKPEDYTRAYVSEWFKVDQEYRKALCAYRSMDDTEVPPHIKLEELVQLVNKRYEEFLEKSNREWLKCLNAYQFDYKQLGFPKQYDFYKNEIEPYDQKVAVIISDALRYEAAEELLSELHGDAKNSADIRYQLASIPSKTSIGMAQLLPGKKYEFNEGAICIDGVSTSGLDNRGKLLTATDDEARVVQFADLQQYSQEKNRELFKSKLVYIYHDAIDMIGDKKVSERKTLAAVKEAIEELKVFVKKLHGTYNVSRVIITADHGFLFNDREIDEKDKEHSSGLNAITTHNRYELVKDDGQPALGYKLPLSATSRFTDDLSVVIPASVNRYKKQGVGHQFVHGGGSLQELVVPIIESSRKRQDITQKVKPVLVKQGPLKVVSNVLRVNILQENKISRTEKERELVVGLYKNSDLVSNEASLLLNSTSGSPSERFYKLELTLHSAAAKETYLKLKVFDKGDRLNPIIEESVDNNTLIAQDF